MTLLGLPGKVRAGASLRAAFRASRARARLAGGEGRGGQGGRLGLPQGDQGASGLDGAQTGQLLPRAAFVNKKRIPNKVDHFFPL